VTKIVERRRSSKEGRKEGRKKQSKGGEKGRKDLMEERRKSNMTFSLYPSLSLGPTKPCFDHFVQQKKVLLCEPSGFQIPKSGRSRKVPKFPRLLPIAVLSTIFSRLTIFFLFLK
jgi:hypothetical protein